jgi:hypothetical protein
MNLHFHRIPELVEGLLAVDAADKEERRPFDKLRDTENAG